MNQQSQDSFSNRQADPEPSDVDELIIHRDFVANLSAGSQQT
ncbi:hypothetical protein KR100_05725 [Synechococcus sp. KORDI-100]|nr:hypothetical protein KR100_05725 [Synechococcus sp. KORDI-100]